MPYSMGPSIFQHSQGIWVICQEHPPFGFLSFLLCGQLGGTSTTHGFTDPRSTPSTIQYNVVTRTIAGHSCNFSPNLVGDPADVDSCG